MGASLGFMLPVSTPCNAIVYSSGYIVETVLLESHKPEQRICYQNLP